MKPDREIRESLKRNPYIVRDIFSGLLLELLRVNEGVTHEWSPEMFKLLRGWEGATAPQSFRIGRDIARIFLKSVPTITIK